ncbi:MAG: DUF262 domain-containing HNH endonuclease family protein [Pseudolabrys sp.]|jgi:hypothetical protein
MPPQLVPIEAKEQKIGQIFSDLYAFEIPAYQRPYAWELEQASDLLGDLLDSMEKKDDNGGVYFLGSIVLIKEPNDPLAKVIDGQQRLTTLTILLSALRDLTTNPEKRFDRGHYIFQKANPDRGTEDRFRLLLRPRDRAFFHKTIQEVGATDSLPDIEALEGSQYRIAANARYLREQLELLQESKRDELVAYLIQRCYLVAVSVPTAEAARRIFTVLNARGLDLTPTDILKASLLDRVSASAERGLSDRWESIENEFDRDGMVELFGHIRMMYEREKPRLALEAGFLKFVSPFSGTPEKFVSDVLEPIAAAFGLLKENETLKQSFGAEAAKAVRSLSRIDNKDWVPPALLALWMRKPNQKSEIAAFLVRLERLAYFLFVTRTGINQRIARFAKIMNEFDSEAPTNSPSLNLTDSEQLEFIEELDGDIYKKARVCKPVLQRLDEALSSGGASYDDLVSIEHVLPQTVDPESEWATLFPSEIVRDEWTHRLSNLVFLTHSINTKASNWDFSKKKLQYFGSKNGSSPFLITQEVLQTESWTKEHLEKRQIRLLEKLSEVWDLNFSKFTSLDGFREGPAADTQSGFTNSAAIEEKRRAIVKALCAREGALLVKNGSALFSSIDGSVKAACTISKRYASGSPYWYGYAPKWDNYLSGTKRSFIVLGCMDRNKAYAIPHDRIAKLLPHLNRSGERHWHLTLEENGSGQIELAVPKSGSRIGLGEFELKLE